MGAGSSRQKLSEVDCRAQEQYRGGGITVSRLGDWVRRPEDFQACRPAVVERDRERSVGTLTTLSMGVKLQAIAVSFGGGGQWI